jgi:hypothetical protein
MALIITRSIQVQAMESTLKAETTGSSVANAEAGCNDGLPVGAAPAALGQVLQYWECEKKT